MQFLVIQTRKVRHWRICTTKVLAVIMCGDLRTPRQGFDFENKQASVMISFQGESMAHFENFRHVKSINTCRLFFWPAYLVVVFKKQPALRSGDKNLFIMRRRCFDSRIIPLILFYLNASFAAQALEFLALFFDFPALPT